MLINEVIRRADALVENEYSAEEKYHWCDVVTAELVQSYSRKYSRVKLFSWADGKFLLPQDCVFEQIDRLIYNGCEIPKEDMRRYGFFAERNGERLYLIKDSHMRGEEAVEVVYMPTPMPVRRIELYNAEIVLPSKDKDGKRKTLRMDNTCPFLPGDSVELVYGGEKRVINILDRQSDMDEISLSLYYVLEYGEGETDDLPTGTIKADMKRIVTDMTLCPAPYDEMYVDYIAAQLSFYQRKYDVYQQFMARYNERFKEYGRQVKDCDTAAVDHRFINWWEL